MIINYTKEIVPKTIKENKSIEINDIRNCYFKYRWNNYKFKNWYLWLFTKDKRLEDNGYIIPENLLIKIEDRSIEYDRMTWAWNFFENNIRDLYQNCDEIEQITEEEFFIVLNKFKLYLNK